jgi:hypothetical protein
MYPPRRAETPQDTRNTACTNATKCPPGGGTLTGAIGPKSPEGDSHAVKASADMSWSNFYRPYPYPLQFSRGRPSLDVAESGVNMAA